MNNFPKFSLQFFFFFGFFFGSFSNLSLFFLNVALIFLSFQNSLVFNIVFSSCFVNEISSHISEDINSIFLFSVSSVLE